MHSVVQLNWPYGRIGIQDGDLMYHAVYNPLLWLTVYQIVPLYYWRIELHSPEQISCYSERWESTSLGETYFVKHTGHGSLVTCGFATIYDDSLAEFVVRNHW